MVEPPTFGQSSTFQNETLSRSPDEESSTNHRKVALRAIEFHIRALGIN